MLFNLVYMKEGDSMSFSLPERVTLKGPNFIREVFERGVGVEGLSALVLVILHQKRFLLKSSNRLLMKWFTLIL